MQTERSWKRLAKECNYNIPGTAPGKEWFEVPGGIDSIKKCLEQIDPNGKFVKKNELDKICSNHIWNNLTLPECNHLCL